MDTSATTHAVHALPSATDSWMYLFSKFTHEAMLFEALALCLGIFGYAVFYLIQKRKYGVAGKEISSGVVKVYLAQLVADAEEMRTQLFGLLGKGEASARLLAGLQFQADGIAPGMLGEMPAGAGATAAGAPTPAAQLVQDPKLAEKLRDLEKKLSDQANALDSVLNEKMKLEEELANAKVEPKGPAAGGPDKSGALNERVKQLESQLAEYAIIEDDLANLKRLQKENKTLKQQLAEAADAGPATKPSAPAAVEMPNLGDAPKEAAPAAAAPSAAASPAPAAEAVAPSFPAPEMPGLPQTEVPPTLDAAPEPSIATEEVVPKNTDEAKHTADFEALVDVVEKNLAEAAKSETIDPAAAEPAPEFKLDPGAISDQKQDEKSEEQLQADFEKMLNS